jgi:hypothetical protein
MGPASKCSLRLAYTTLGWPVPGCKLGGVVHILVAVSVCACDALGGVTDDGLPEPLRQDSLHLGHP